LDDLEFDSLPSAKDQKSASAAAIKNQTGPAVEPAKMFIQSFDANGTLIFGFD
jgi:hypothetical protein